MRAGGMGAGTMARQVATMLPVPSRARLPAAAICGSP